MEFVRIRVELPFYDSIPRGVFLAVGDNDSTWLQFQYERLPLFCFQCGKIGHKNKECDSLSQTEMLYGDWLRAYSDIKCPWKNKGMAAPSDTHAGTERDATVEHDSTDGENYVIIPHQGNFERTEGRILGDGKSGVAMGEGTIPTLVGTLNFNPSLSIFNDFPKISFGPFYSENHGSNRGEEEEWAGPYVNMDCHSSSEISPNIIEMVDANVEPNKPNCMAMQLSHAKTNPSNNVVQLESTSHLKEAPQTSGLHKKKR